MKNWHRNKSEILNFPFISICLGSNHLEGDEKKYGKKNQPEKGKTMTIV